jgi:hypothetical protein
MVATSSFWKQPLMVVSTTILPIGRSAERQDSAVLPIHLI